MNPERTRFLDGSTVQAVIFEWNITTREFSYVKKVFLI